MLLTIFNVIYVLVAIGMIVLILLQRGAGAAAGSGFGGGASGTVFGARGATTFLSRSTAVLAGGFFLLSLAMGIYLGHAGTSKPAEDLGIMSGVETPKAPAAPAPAGEVPVPAAGGPAAETPAAPSPASGEVPAPAAAAPAAAAPAENSDKPATAPAPSAKKAKKDGKGKPAEPEKH